MDVLQRFAVVVAAVPVAMGEAMLHTLRGFAVHVWHALERVWSWWCAFIRAVFFTHWMEQYIQGPTWYAPAPARSCG